jgi:geranylgeranyl pyrophosphate synthase
MTRPGRAALFRRTFQEAHAVARRLLRRHVSPADAPLPEILRDTIRGQSTSEYPFVFKYAFCSRGSDAGRIRTLTGAVHLLQSSGYVTDDIFDRTPLRYGEKAVHIRYGVDTAIIAGTLMQTIALEAISAELARGRFPNAGEAMTVFHRIIRELFVGQFLDIRNSASLRVTERDYFRVIALGVGRYFGHVARCGALLAGKDRSQVEALTAFGTHYGLAVFLTDDILDIRVKPRSSGLLAGSDLMNRRMRLPVLRALRLAGPRDRAALRRFLLHPGPAGRAGYDRIAAIIERSGALLSCRATAQRQVEAALRSLRRVPPGYGVAMLRWLAETLMKAQGLEE